MLKQLLDWLDERIEARKLWETLTNRPIPGGSNWFFVLGSSLLFVFVLQMATGILLTLYYAPVPDHAYQSVKYIQEEALFGSFVRGLHHWGASAMVVLTGLHMLRVILHGAYKFPREVTWFTGVGLLLVVIAFGFTGYLLPWDQKAYWATTVGTRMAGTPPLIGDFILRIVRGGNELSAVTLARFYGVHIWVLPAALLLLVSIHLFLVIRIGISAAPRRED